MLAGYPRWCSCSCGHHRWAQFLNQTRAVPEASCSLVTTLSVRLGAVSRFLIAWRIAMATLCRGQAGERAQDCRDR